MVSRRPFLWTEGQALNFPTIRRKIAMQHPEGQAISREMIALIFFEETGFCNVRQSRGKGPAVGFGQMEIYNYDKRPFFETLGYNTNRYIKHPELPLLTPEMVTQDHDFSVGMTCKYFQWLAKVHGKSKLGCLQAQAGSASNMKIIPTWLEAEKRLKEAMGVMDRAAVLDALNHARRGGPHPNPIPEKLFKEYWEFTLPHDFFKYGF